MAFLFMIKLCNRKIRRKLQIFCLREYFADYALAENSKMVLQFLKVNECVNLLIRRKYSLGFFLPFLSIG